MLFVNKTRIVWYSANNFSLFAGNIGGNMGLFLGGSVISLFEMALLTFKVGWALISSKRTRYMKSKRIKEVIVSLWFHLLHFCYQLLHILYGKNICCLSKNMLPHKACKYAGSQSSLFRIIRRAYFIDHNVFEFGHCTVISRPLRRSNHKTIELLFFWVA